MPDRSAPKSVALPVDANVTNSMSALSGSPPQISPLVLEAPDPVLLKLVVKLPKSCELPKVDIVTKSMASVFPGA